MVISLFVILYLLLSIPPFQNYIKNLAAGELSALLESEVSVSSLRIVPFNEIVVEDLSLYDPDGNKCLQIETVGAGINLWKLLLERKIELTYAEIIGLHGVLVQPEEGAPLNMQFIFDAFAPKEENKEKKHFELALRNVVLRKSSFSFKRPWLQGKTIGKVDLGNLEIENLRADITFPKISDSEIAADLRRLSLVIPGVTSLNKLAFKGNFGEKGFFISGLNIELPESKIFIPSLELPLAERETPKEALETGLHSIVLSDSYISPSDFEALFSPLSSFHQRLPLEMNVEGNLQNLSIKKFSFGSSDLVQINLSGAVKSLDNRNSLSGSLNDFGLTVTHRFLEKLLPSVNGMPEKITRAILNGGTIVISGQGEGALFPLAVNGNLKINSEIIKVAAEGKMTKKDVDLSEIIGEIVIDKLALNKLVPDLPVENLSGEIAVDAILDKNMPEGSLMANIDKFNLKGTEYSGFILNAKNDRGNFEGNLIMDNAIGNIGAFFSGFNGNELKRLNFTCELNGLNLSEIIDMKNFRDYLISGNISLDAEGEDINDVDGKLMMDKFTFTSPDYSKRLKLNHLEIEAGVVDSLRSIKIDSDWLQGNLNGKFRFTDVAAQLQQMAHNVLPALVSQREKIIHNELTDLDFQLVVKANNSLIEFFNIPYRLLVPIVISANVDENANTASLALDLPYLQKGRDKLIYDTRFVAMLNGESSDLSVLAETTMPVKYGDLSLSLNLSAQEDLVETDLRWQNTENSDFRGNISFLTEIMKNELTLKPEFTVEIKPTLLSMGTADWIMEKCRLSYYDRQLEVDGLKLWHGDQFVKIDGVASHQFADVLKIDLADIDVNYIFDMLSINYVTFGGIATGEVRGHGLLGPDMSAETESLSIKEFSYNGAVLGLCDVSSRWNNAEKEVEIAAEITRNDKVIVNVNGGVWVTRDSLSFDIMADKVPVEFIQPFMSVFSSHVGGLATGDVSLFGTFKDIDLVGKVFADSIAIKLDYTNTVYHGSDSVILHPGFIEIPGFRLYDQYGNSALLSGELTHNYFHEPRFTFRLADADNFLCYDTNSELNPDWYGTLYGSGSALLRGEPGIVDIGADMTIAGNSRFTFVLNDTQYAQDYQFLTFSDRRAETLRQSQPDKLDFKEIFRRRKQEEEGSPSRFAIDIRATVTPAALFTLVMDPAAGDKITARGRGALQVKYESDNDEMQMYGKYELAEGNYNFSLQEIILRDFKIKEGSSISFNGNPLTADLDISAAYRVNTNLSDLDKSFSSDRDLNRTNVPVDAILMVKGDMQNPDITFDVELPTLTQDVERKVKSIISTDDMMNRQIIYLLALNRFYTPEYMGSSSNGSELAAVASTTLSSQLSNILGQLTDKVSVSPSFRSDKGDFSDIEVDVALSSRLLNNRLLINGNFGYRDKNNSSTTFVGDFDMEYLLSKNGNLRLKAYNHFNDQNYYLREALTTQGLGVVWRKDFDTFFPFLKKNKKTSDTVPEEKKDDTGKLMQEDKE